MVLASIYGAVKGQENENPCQKGVDLGIIVDRSRSVKKQNFITVKNDLKTFLDNFNISENGTHVSLIFFANTASLLFNLSDARYFSNQAVKDRIDNVKDKLYAGTRTDLALMKAHDEMFQREHVRRKHSQVLLIFTDGNTAKESAPYSETVPPLEDKGVTIVAIGIGSSIKDSELKKIAGDRGTWMKVPDFDSLGDKLNEILVGVCVINGGYTTWSGWSECSVTCGGGTRTRTRNCTNPVPMGGGKDCSDIGEPVQEQECNNQTCELPIDGGYTRWTTWSTCSKTCGKGTQIRFRSCTDPPPNGGGRSCAILGKPTQTKKCKLAGCKKQPAPCKQGLDLGILIDRSSSIRPVNHERLLKDFLPKFLKSFKIAKRKTNVGIIAYDEAAELLAPFNGRNSRSKTRIINFVKSLHPGVQLQTRTDKGLIAANKELFTKGNGDRKSHQNVLVTFTDGRAWPKRRIKPFTETVPPLMQGRKVHMVAVGYGLPYKLNVSQLHDIAGENVIPVPRPRQITRMAKKIKKVVCQVDGGYSAWSMWSMCSATCGEGVRMRSRICNSPPPRKGGKHCASLGSNYETATCNEAECPIVPSPCEHKKLDVCLIVDSSKSVGVQNYVRVKTFLIQFIHQFEPDTHFSVITFSRKPIVQCKFDSPQCQSPDATHGLISEIPDKVSWGTATDRALVAADQIVFTRENGERADAANIVVVVTDGRTMKGSLPFNITVPPLREGKQAKVLAFGVGPSIREEDLNEMAGEKNWFYVEQFEEMKYRIYDILETACGNITSVNGVPTSL